MKYKSRDASIENVKKFFSKSSGDIVSVKEVFQAFERDPKEEKLNRGWLSNLLSLMKSHNLIRPHYTTKKGPRTLVEFELTLEGKKALGRINGNGEISNKEDGRSEISIEDILEALPDLREKFQGFNIVFSVTPKEKS